MLRSIKIENKKNIKYQEKIRFFQYYQDLYQFAKLIEKIKADCIIAISRKGPLLLNLINKLGFFHSLHPIICEKTIDFLSPTEVEKITNIVIIDDIIIVGSTIYNLVYRLHNIIPKANIKVVCFALDKNTIKFSSQKTRLYQIKIKEDDMDFVCDLETQVLLDRDERYAFCSQIIDAFTILCRTLEIDLPIFHISNDIPDIEDFFSKYSLTTNFHESQGYFRYTYLPKNNNHFSLLLQSFLNVRIEDQIVKIRYYTNELGLKSSITPMYIFNVKLEEICNKTSIFSKDMECLNDIINLVEDHKFLSYESKIKCRFRTVFYLINFLYGLYFLNLCKKNEDKEIEFSNLIYYEDLLLIFGEELGESIFKSLSTSFKSIDKIINFKLTNSIKYIHEASIKSSIILNFKGGKCEKIESILSENPSIKSNNYEIYEKIACLFEENYLNEELPIYNSSTKINKDSYKRLKQGFNFSSIISQLDLKENIIEASIAFDYLIDLGVIIPYFNEDCISNLKKSFQSDQWIFREFCYGELGFIVVKFEWFVTKTFQELISDQKNVPISKIVLEKLAVLTFSELNIEKDEAYQWLTKETLRRNKNLHEIRFYFQKKDFHKHGAIFLIKDPTITRLPERNEFHFVEWCKRKEIVTENNQISVKINLNHINDKRLQRFKQIPLDTNSYIKYCALKLKFFFELDSRYPKTQILTFITSCAVMHDYLYSLNKGLYLLLTSPFHGLKIIYEMLDEDTDKTDNEIRDQWKSIRNSVINTAEELDQKQTMFKQRNYYFTEIKKHTSNDLFNTYLENLYNKMQHEIEKNINSSLEALKTEIEKLCIIASYLTSVLEAYLVNSKNISLSTEKWHIWIRNPENISFQDLSIGYTFQSFNLLLPNDFRKSLRQNLFSLLDIYQRKIIDLENGQRLIDIQLDPAADFGIDTHILHFLDDQKLKISINKLQYIAQSLDFIGEINPLHDRDEYCKSLANLIGTRNKYDLFHKLLNDESLSLGLTNVWQKFINKKGIRNFFESK